MSKQSETPIYWQLQHEYAVARLTRMTEQFHLAVARAGATMNETAERVRKAFEGVKW